MFLQINQESYIIERITYNSFKTTKKLFRIEIEKTSTSEKIEFECRKNCRHYSFIEIIFKNPPVAKTRSQNELFRAKPSRNLLWKRVSTNPNTAVKNLLFAILFPTVVWKKTGTTTLGYSTRCHRLRLCTRLQTFTTFEFNIKCLWQ